MSRGESRNDSELLIMQESIIHQHTSATSHGAELLELTMAARNFAQIPRIDRTHFLKEKMIEGVGTTRLLIYQLKLYT